jgi:uncharacterized membrane protein
MIATRLVKRYAALRRSIGFYPTIITSAFIVMAAGLFILDRSRAGDWFVENFSAIAVRNNDTARLITGTLIGGMISMMVFSFTMVMTTLSRAATSLSPRVVPGIISKRSHQITLGFNLGTILFCILLTTRIAQDAPGATPPSIGLFIAILVSLINLVLFVVFIASISSSIQVDKITEEIYRQTMMQLNSALSHGTTYGAKSPPDTTIWHSIPAQQTGYFLSLDRADLTTLCFKHKVSIWVLVPHGQFIREGGSLMKISKPLDPALVGAILECFTIDTQESSEDHYHFGLKKLTEIAVKALSPAINDPGTAIKCVDLFSVLIPKLMVLPDPLCVCDQQGQPRIWIVEPPLKDRLTETLMQIYHYGKADAVVTHRILECLFRIQSEVNGNPDIQSKISHIFSRSQRHLDGPMPAFKDYSL